MMQQGSAPARKHETVVIGGGPAGAAAAVKLARAGEKVCLLERKPAAHDKVCGEFISAEAAHYLNELGVDLPALGAEPIHRVGLYSGGEELLCELPFTGWSLSRRRLDTALLRQAKKAGADVRMGVAVRELTRVDETWNLITAGNNLAGKNAKKCAGQTLQAPTIFLASGKHDLRHWRRGTQRQNSQNLIGLKMHLQPNESQRRQFHQTVELHLFDGGYAGLEPVEEGKINLCFLIDKNIYAACGRHWPAVLQWLGNTSPHIKTRLAGAVPLWPEPLAVSGVPYGYLHSPASTVPGLFRLGDQTAVIPSFAGDGIAIALRSAMLAAQVHLAGGTSASYQRQAQHCFIKPVRHAQSLAGLLAFKPGRRAAFWFARRWPGLLTRAITSTRIDRV